MTSSGADTNFSNEQMLGFYRDMLRIRRVEEQLGKDSLAGNLPGAVHLYIGQEAVGVGICSQLRDDDWIASNHRGHGHFLAKGGDTKLLVAEVYGRKTGICHPPAGPTSIRSPPLSWRAASGRPRSLFSPCLHRLAQNCSRQ